ncbi:MAG: hypothetical protein RMK49_18570 [Abditibacteriales bacterium]|nr:hypothetical protein [Abditibacteriales bacterium]
MAGWHVETLERAKPFLLRVQVGRRDGSLLALFALALLAGLVGTHRPYCLSPPLRRRNRLYVCHRTPSRMPSRRDGRHFGGLPCRKKVVLVVGGL